MIDQVKSRMAVARTSSSAAPPEPARDIWGSTLGLLAARRVELARLSAVVAVAAVVLGWGVGQWPWLLVDAVEVEVAAGASTTLWALVVTFGLAAVTVVPALAYLYWLTQRDEPLDGD